MSTGVRAFAESHPLLTYFVLTFATSWSGVLLVIGGPYGFAASQEHVAQLMPLVVVAMIGGPAITSLVLTGLYSGRAGLRGIGSRLVRWRVGLRWYGLALLIAPIVMTAMLFALSLFSREFLPRIVTANNRASLMLLALGTVLVGGLSEELGWTGYAIPRLKQHHGVLATGLIVGGLWGAWHFPANVWYGGAVRGSMSPAVFALLYCLSGIAQLTAYRVLMVWVYDRTDSLLVATLMHGSLIASTAMPILVPPTTGRAFLTWLAGSAAVLWVLVAAVFFANRAQRLRADRSGTAAARGDIPSAKALRRSHRRRRWADRDGDARRLSSRPRLAHTRS